MTSVRPFSKTKPTKPETPQEEWERRTTHLRPFVKELVWKPQIHAQYRDKPHE